MASSSPAGQIDKDFLTCRICCGLLNEPKQLPCLHSFCKLCIQSRLVEQPDAPPRCPICKQTWVLPPKGVEALTSNDFIDNLRDVVDAEDAASGKTEVRCGCCENAAGRRCVDCAQFLCDVCFSAHGKLTATRNHRSLTIDEFCSTAQDGSRSNRQPLCPYHGSEVEFFCHTCRKAICYKCTLIEHRVPEHRHVYLKDAAVQQTGDFRRILEKAKTKLSVLRSGRDAVAATSRDIQDGLEREGKELEKQVNQVIKRVKEEREKLRGELQMHGQAKQRVLKLQEEDLVAAIEALSTACDVSEKLLRHGTDVEILLSKKQMEDRVAQLLSLDTRCEPEENSHLQFIPNTNFPRGFLGRVLSDSTSPQLALSHSPDFKTPSKYDAVWKAQNALGLSKHHTTLGETRASQSRVELERTTRGCVGADSGFSGIAVNSSGIVAVADSGGHRVFMYDIELNLQNEIGFKNFSSQFSPVGVAFASDSRLVVTDSLNSQVVICTLDGNLVSCYGNERMKYPEGLAVSRDGHVHVIDRGLLGNHCIHTTDMEGRNIHTVVGKELEHGEFEFPSSIAVNSKNNVILTDSGNDRVLVFDSNTNFLFSFGCYGDKDGQFSWATGVAVDSEDNIYVCDSNNRRVQSFDPDGKFLNVVASKRDGLTDPRSVCVTATRKLVLLDGDELKVFKIRNATTRRDYVKCVDGNQRVEENATEIC
ncbi:tripartite motif-containing protein 2-like [Ptychodera flava]|uniref:tripartite motif-containing protein 2-like n=1 Tax=Ptychodera flava TaxID=63121 RepID=UPI00396A2EED